MPSFSGFLGFEGRSLPVSGTKAYSFLQLHEIKDDEVKYFREATHLPQVRNILSLKSDRDSFYGVRVSGVSCNERFRGI